MKIRSLLASALVTITAFNFAGCAAITTSKTQTVVVRTTPAGAVAKINGTEVGKTPFKVKLARADTYLLNFNKPGFAPQAALLLPSSTKYEQRFLRWGIDYDLGLTTDIIPGELSVTMKPQLGDVSAADRFAEMTAQINRADAMVEKGEISAADHKYLVEQIAATYHSAP